MDVKNRFDALEALDGDNVGSSWEKLSGAIVDAGTSVDPATLDDIRHIQSIAAKANARNQGLIKECRRL